MTSLKPVKIIREITYYPTDEIVNDLFGGKVTQQEFAEWIKEYSDEDYDNWQDAMSKGIQSDSLVRKETFIAEYQES